MELYALQLDKRVQGERRGFRCCYYHPCAEEGSLLYLEDTQQEADLSETLLHMYQSVRRHIKEESDLDSFRTAYFIQGVITAWVPTMNLKCSE